MHPLGVRLLVFALLLPVAAASADVLVPRRGRKVEGVVVSDAGGTVVFNVYWSRNPGVTNSEHVLRLAADAVKRLEIAPHPEVEIHRRIQAGAGDADALAAAGAYAEEHRLEAEARMAYALALAADPEHKAALDGIGGRSKWARERKGNPFLDPAVRDALVRYVGEDAPAGRRAVADALEELGFEADPAELERHRRAALAPEGLQEDVALSWGADRNPGAVYTRFVPDAYEAWRPWPLIVGLHGGGPDGKAVDEVVGSGASAMNFYRIEAARRGYLVACPDALSAGWGSKDNEQLVRDVIAEMRRLYNVDVDRIYLTGHSMGGFGTWALGPRLAEDLAAVSPMAGAGRGGIDDLVETRTPIFIYHSADDYVSVEPDRAAAKRLKDTALDFVYTELPDAGHGFPDSVRDELFDFFGPRRRHERRRKDAWPRSSLLGKVDKEEVRYLGDPMAEMEGETPDLDALEDAVRLGGGCALRATRTIVETKPDGAARKLERIVGDARVPFDGRAYAARALAALEARDAAGALGEAVAAEAAKEQSMIAVEAARALVALGATDELDALDDAIGTWTAYYASKVMSGSKMRFSDWKRSAGTLTVLVESWAALARPESERRSLERTVVEKVLRPAHEVETSERVPQDPSVQRVALARALGRAWAATRADAAAWEALLEALAADAEARQAAASARGS